MKRVHFVKREEYTLDLVFHRRRLGDIVYTLEYIHRKRSLYLPVGSVNLVSKVMGTPDEISSPPGWNRLSQGCPRNFNTELTEPTRQVKTTFPMNVLLNTLQRTSWSLLVKRRVYARCCLSQEKIWRHCVYSRVYRCIQNTLEYTPPVKDSRIYSLVYSPESIFTFLCTAATLHLMNLMLSLCKARSMGWLRLVGSLKL